MRSWIIHPTTARNRAGSAANGNTGKKKPKPKKLNWNKVARRLDHTDRALVNGVLYDLTVFRAWGTGK